MTRDRLHILHLTTYLQGGAGRVITDLALRQRRDGHRVTVLTSRTPVEGYGNYPQYLTELMEARIGAYQTDSLFVRDYAQNLAVVRLLDEALGGSGEPDVIHSHAAVPSLIALMFAGTQRRPIALLQTMHGWGVAKTPEQSAGDVRVLNLVDRVAVPSEASRAEIERLGVRSAHVVVVPNGVGEMPRVRLDARDQALVDDMRRRRREGALVVACVGTIGARKNQALVVEALAAVAPRTRISCVFVGDGDAAGLQALAAARGVSARVTVHGYSAAARQIAAEADALVLPSRSEGQPIAVLEAFCDRRLVIASDIPELAELVEHRSTGVCFAAGNASALADTLSDVAEMPRQARQAIVEAARLRYDLSFSVDHMTQAYGAEYAALLRRRTHAEPHRLFVPNTLTA